MNAKRWMLTACAAAATCLSTGAGQSFAGALNSRDQQFLKEADQIDLTEVKLGNLAQNRAAAPVVKQFGQRMIRDHSRMNRELRAIARKENFVLPTTLDNKDQELVSQLGTMTGTHFDRAYAHDMVPGHKEAIHKFEVEAAQGTNPQLKAWADKWCPTLEEHLRLAQQAVKQVTAP